jgi:acetoin utilization protein AcuC
LRSSEPQVGEAKTHAGRAAVFIGSAQNRGPAFGANHPLAIPRVATVMDLCASLGWLTEGDYRESPTADTEQLAQFHAPDYIDALRAAAASQQVDALTRERYAIGTMENPIFPGVFTKAATAVGGSVLAAELALAGRVAFHPAGGTHHGRPARASGFCYFNDPVFALRGFTARGLTRILYVDLDAHHGDGVQDAVQHDWRIHTISVHESGRWPFTGDAADRAAGQARNFPVPAGFNDTELEYLMDTAVLPLARALAPQGLVITCGTDALAGDPLSGLLLSNGALWRAVLQLVALAPAAVVLGGGGYNPWTLARCWSGLWARLSGRDIPTTLPAGPCAILAGLACDLVEEEDVAAHWLTTLSDAPRDGPVRVPVRDLVRRVMDG